MRIDLLEPPETFYYEDGSGNVISDPDPKKYMVSKYLVVKEVIFNMEKRESKWPVKFLKWCIKKCPNGWKNSGGKFFEGETTVNSCFSIVNYLVKNRNWRFNDAAVLCSDLCSRCSNLIEDELDHKSLEEYSKDKMGTHCKYCEIIDPDYHKRHRVWCVYRTSKLGGDINKAYNDVSCYSKEK